MAIASEVQVQVPSAPAGVATEKHLREDLLQRRETTGSWADLRRIIDEACSESPDCEVSAQAVTLRERMRQAIVRSGWVAPGHVTGIVRQVDSAHAEAARCRADAEMGKRLLAILSNHTGERDQLESPEDVLKRLVRERNEARGEVMALRGIEGEELRDELADTARRLALANDLLTEREQLIEANSQQIERLAEEVRRLRAEADAQEGAEKHRRIARFIANALHEHPIPLTEAGTEALGGLLVTLHGGAR